MIVAVGLFLFAFLVVRPLTDILVGGQQNDTKRVEKGKKGLIRSAIILVILIGIGVAIHFLDGHPR